MSTLKDEILKYPKLLNVNGNLNSTMFRKGSTFLNSKLAQTMFEKTSFLHNSPTFTERLYNIVNDITSPTLCLHCKRNYVEFKCFSYGYRTYCSGTCNNNSTETKNKIKNSHIMKYGKHFSQTNDYNEQCKQTNRNKRGVDYCFQSKAVQDNIQNTNIRKYGTPNSSQRHISKHTLDRINDKDWLITQNKIHKHSLIQIANLLGDVRESTISARFKLFGISPIIYNGNSLPEKNLVQYIQEKYKTEIITNDRTIIKPKEIDIYLPEYKLAIEYNGIYWHRPEKFGGYDSWFKYHNHKINECTGKGIKLLHLWEGYGNHMTRIDEVINGQLINNNLELVYNEIFLKT